MPKTLRQPNIPASVLAKRARAAAAAPEEEGEEGDAAMDIDEPTKKLERDLQEENGGAGVYSMDWRKLYGLKKEDWKYDVIPEIVDGKNIADFIDPDIERKLAALEREEDAREAVRDVENDLEVDGYRILTAEEMDTVRAIKEKKA
eukprot:IDg13356t1